jgi:protein TonB
MRNGFLTLAPLAAALIAAFAAPLPSAAAPESTANTTTNKGATCRIGRTDAAPAFLVQPDTPPAAVAEGASTGTVVVRVDLSDQGKLEKSSILATSGDFFLDREALSTVREMAFTPEKINCLPVGGTYAVRVDFQS